MSKTAERRPSSVAALEPQEKLRLMRILLAVALGVRLVYGAAMELVPDESYYWVWSRHLALGYFDHPPMIAYLIWLGTWLFGDKEIGVRFLIAVMSVGTIALIIAMAKRLLRDDRAVVWVALIWLTSPLLMGLGIFATPDTPAVFFSTCALAFAALIALRDDGVEQCRPDHLVGLWALFGLFSGLAMDSKYTAVLLPFSVALAMLTSAKGRRHYRRPGIYLSGLIALAVFSPVIWWNKQHGWASFLFQIKHGTTGGESSRASASAIGAIGRVFTDLGTYVGDQLAIWTPLLFVVVLIVLVRYWRRYRTITQLDRVLLWAATVPLVFFALAMFRSHHTEPNWPAFAYVPASLLIGRWLSESWSKQRVGLVRGGVQVATAFLIGMLAIGAPPVTRWITRLPFHVPHALSDLQGWPTFGQWLGHLSQDCGNAMVVTNKHQNAGEAAFYMPGQPGVWSDGIGSRPNAFDYFDDAPDFGKMSVVIWVGGHHDLFARKYGYIEFAQTTYHAFSGRNPDPRTEVAYVLVRPAPATVPTTAPATAPTTAPAKR